MRIALVHDWLTGMRGGEKVLEVLCELFPEADILTLVHEHGTVSARIERHRIITSALQRVPWARRRYPYCLPMFPALVEAFDLDPYDFVISTSHCAVKAVVPTGRARHLSYCHSPMRYAWDQFDAYFGPERVGPAASRWLFRPILSRLARWDAATAGRVDRFVTNSRCVAARIRRYYNRGSTIVHPPVDTEFYYPDATIPDGNFLIVSALVPYKRIELAIHACQRVGAGLRIVGEGPERHRLERLAGPGVEFLGRVSDEAVRAEYRRATAVLLPGEEDFGIVPLESQACGRPVVALGRGGALDTVTDGLTGILVSDTSVEALASGLERCLATRFDVEVLRAHAEQFSRARCLMNLRTVIQETMTAPSGARW